MFTMGKFQLKMRPEILLAVFNLIKERYLRIYEDLEVPFGEYLIYWLNSLHKQYRNMEESKKHTITTVSPVIAFEDASLSHLKIKDFQKVLEKVRKSKYYY